MGTNRAQVAVGLLASIVVSRTAIGHDVTSEASRRQTLLEYVAGRTELPADERRAWQQALRTTFGGKAIKDGTDEGVTTAKSVVAAAIFHGVDPVIGARAAYAAYHDTYRWVPPPIAIEYQVLALTGRAPAASPRQMAFAFPRHFHEDVAPELARWWDEMLRAGKIPEAERDAVAETLRETRERMRPMLRDRLWSGAQMEARRAMAAGDRARELDLALAALRGEIERDYQGVGAPSLLRSTRPYYERYVALCRELGEAPRPRPETGATDRPPPASSLSVQREGSPPLAPAPSAGDGLRARPSRFAHALVAVVDRWIGTPYRWGGTDRRGIDCSAFVRQIFRESLQIELPRNTVAQYGLGAPVSRDRLTPGDLIFFDTLERGRVTHVGVYLGEGTLAHASSSKGVTRAQLDKRYYERAYVGGRRLLSP